MIISVPRAINNDRLGPVDNFSRGIFFKDYCVLLMTFNIKAYIIARFVLDDRDRFHSQMSLQREMRFEKVCSSILQT